MDVLALRGRLTGLEQVLKHLDCQSLTRYVGSLNLSKGIANKSQVDSIEVIATTAQRCSSLQELRLKTNVN